MASAYELMLVLRGRNYLSNDLRRASGDVAGLSRKNALAGLANQKKQLDINARRLASTKAIAQAERDSIQTGSRGLALKERAAKVARDTQVATEKLAIAQRAVNANADLQVANQAKIAAATKAMANMPQGSGSWAMLKEQRAQLLAVDRELIAESTRLNAALQVEQGAMSKAAFAAQKLDAALIGVARREAILTDKIATTEAALSLNATKLEENALAAKMVGSHLGQVAKVAESVGRTMQTFGLVTTAAFAGAAYAAAKFNTSVTLAATQSTLPGNNSVMQVQKNAQFLQSQLQGMLLKGQTPARTADLTGGLYTIFSGLSLKGGQKAQLNEGLSILKEFSKVFTANYGQVSFNDVTKAGIALINNFGLSASKIPSVMNQMQASVRFGAMTMGEMTSSLNQVIPAFKAAGYSTKQMFSDIAFVSRVFPSLRIGTTGLARLTETFGKYHDAISKDIGVNIAPGGKLSPVAQIVQDIIKAHPTLAKGGVDLQNYFKAVTGASQFVNARRVFSAYVTRLGLYHDVAGKVANDNNELAKSFTNMSQTPQVRWAELTNQLHGFILELGTAALPVFQKMAAPLKSMVNWFDRLSPSTKKWVGELGAGLGVFLLVGGTLSVVVGMFTRLALGFRTVSGLGGGLSRIMGRGLGFRALAGEAGMVSPQFAAISAAAIILLPLLDHFHGGILHAATGAHGFAAALKLLEIAIAALTIRSLVLGLVKLIPLLFAAATETGVFATAIVGLEAASAAEIIAVAALGYALSRLIRMIPGWNSAFHSLGGAIYDAFHQKMDLTSPAGTKLSGRQGLDARQQAYAISQYAALRRSGMNAGDADTWIRGMLGKRYSKDSASAINALAHVAEGRYGTGGIAGQNRSAGFSGSGSDVSARAIAAQARAQNFNVNAAIANVERLRAAANKTPTLANWTKYENALASLQSHFTGSALTGLNDYLNAIESATKKSLTKQKKAATDAARQTASELKSIASNAMTMYDQLLQQNQGIMGSLFSGPYINSPRVQNQLQYGGRLTGRDYLKDIKSQTAQFRNFYAEINRLQKRGAPQELIQQLIAAGPSALPAIKSLAGMGNKQWSQYIKIFNEGQKILHNQTIKQLKAQLKDYRKYGTHIAEQIISGMRDKRLGLANEIKHIIKSMFGVNVPLVTKAAHSTAVSDAVKVAKGHAGVQPHGTYTGSKTHSKPIIGTHTRSTQGVTVNNYNYNVTAPTSEHTSIKAQLRHAEFARKTKYGVRN